MRSERLREFIETVCGQVKAKKAHGLIGSELMAHIEDQKLTYIKDGMNETAAENRAIDEMGDPVEVGENLNKIHQPAYDWIGRIPDIIMWIIAGGIVLISVIFGIGIIISMISVHPGDYIAALIVGLGIIFFGAFIGFVFVSMFKFISNMLFYHGIISDYKRRKKRGRLYDYKKH